MNNSTLNTALILFTRTASEEAKVKKFSYRIGKNGNELIAGKLIGYATQLARGAGVDFFVFTEKEQRGIDFGERLARAYHEVFCKGYERVISIGNDCPDLDQQTIVKAIKDLQVYDAVVGPAKDGGVYLLGLTKKEFNKKGFAQLRWKTDQLVQDVLNSLTVHAEVKLLHILADIDHDKDLNNFLLSNTSLLANRLRSLLRSYEPQWYGSHINRHIGKLIFQGTPRRGPPTS